MKKYFIVIVALMFAVFANGQQIFKDLKTGSKTYAYAGSAAKGDTVIKSQSKNYDFFTGTLFNTMQFQVETDTVTGKPKTRYYIYQSFDYQNWYYVDSSRTVTGGGFGLTAKATLFAPFGRLIVKGIDSTQKTVVNRIIVTYKTE